MLLYTKQKMLTLRTRRRKRKQPPYLRDRVRVEAVKRINLALMIVWEGLCLQKYQSCDSC